MSPDDTVIPLVAGFGDLLGVLLLFVCFYLASLVEKPQTYSHLQDEINVTAMSKIGKPLFKNYTLTGVVLH
jgi:hypothetical protein